MKGRFGSVSLAILAVVTVAITRGSVTSAGAAAPATGSGLPTEFPVSGSVTPNAVNELDCNGYSPIYTPAKASMKPLCADPVQRDQDGSYYKFNDNGHYIGHDEPSVKFESPVSGSGNNNTYFMQLPVDPAAAPTPNGSTSIYAMTGPAPWFDMSLCDPNSNPGGPCTPDSDPPVNDPDTAGQAFMELQFYPPGLQPFMDNVSCDATKWCAALTIDSVTCVGCSVTSGTGAFNPNCVEPVNFAYLQTDGTPAGPPSPQLADLSTFTPNASTLKMSQGDALRVHLFDNRAADGSGGLVTRIDDITTGQSGFMTASANNGFMTTDSTTCNGAPFSFHPTYDTASQANMLPWSVLEGGILMEQEIGHMETCASIKNPGPTVIHYSAANEFFIDNSTQQTCVGGIAETGVAGSGTTQDGEGPCASFSLLSSCFNAMTEGGQACPNNVGQGVALSCEGSDATCIPAGPRSVTEATVLPTTPPSFVSQTSTYTNPLNECQANQSQNGDLDFDGNSYIPDWPDGTASHPSSMRYLGPFDPNGNPYPKVQIETDLAGSENNCNIGSASPSNCKIPPFGPGNQQTFYPYFSLTSAQGLDGVSAPGAPCAWNFGNTIAGITTNDLGKTAEYGSGTATTRGDFISNQQDNPEFTAGCPAATLGPQINPCGPLFTVAPGEADSYAVQGQNLGQTTFPSQLDILSGNIAGSGSTLQVTLTVAGLNTTLPPGSGENDYRVTWVDGATKYFVLAAVEPTARWCSATARCSRSVPKPATSRCTSTPGSSGLRRRRTPSRSTSP